MPLERKSPHILSTSANLLGFCLVILTSLKISNYSESTRIDEFTGLASVLLIASCILSFLSMKSKDVIQSEKIESVADVIFLLALIFIFITILIVSFNLFGIE